jgi:hypothetical protein
MLRLRRKTLQKGASGLFSSQISSAFHLRFGHAGTLPERADPAV